MSDTDGRHDGIRWPLVLGLLGASVGVTFVLYVVGSIAETRRFDALELPGAQTITAVSRDSLVVVGGRALAAPFLAAVCTSALFYLLIRLSQWKGVAPVAALLILVLIAALVLGKTHVVTWENAGFIALIALVSALAWLSIRRGWLRGRTHHVAAVGLGVAGMVAVVVLVHIWRPPVDLEYAEVDLVNDDHASGIYLTLTSDDLYLAPATKCANGTFRTHRRVVVLPRAKIVRITLSRKAHVWDGGPDMAAAC